MTCRVNIHTFKKRILQHSNTRKQSHTEQIGSTIDFLMVLCGIRFQSLKISKFLIVSVSNQIYLDEKTTKRLQLHKTIRRVVFHKDRNKT